MTRIAVASRSFASNPVLRAELLARYPEVTFIQSPTVPVQASHLACLRSG